MEYYPYVIVGLGILGFLLLIIGAATTADDVTISGGCLMAASIVLEVIRRLRKRVVDVSLTHAELRQVNEEPTYAEITRVNEEPTYAELTRADGPLTYGQLRKVVDVRCIRDKIGEGLPKFKLLQKLTNQSYLYECVGTEVFQFICHIQSPFDQPKVLNVVPDIYSIVCKSKVVLYRIVVDVYLVQNNDNGHVDLSATSGVEQSLANVYSNDNGHVDLSATSGVEQSLVNVSSSATLGVEQPLVNVYPNDNEHGKQHLVNVSSNNNVSRRKQFKKTPIGESILKSIIPDITKSHLYNYEYIGEDVYDVKSGGHTFRLHISKMNPLLNIGEYTTMMGRTFGQDKVIVYKFKRHIYVVLIYSVVTDK